MHERMQHVGAVWACVLWVAISVASAEAAPNSGWVTSAVGTVTVQGSATINASGHASVSGEGTDIGSTADGFQLLLPAALR